MIEIPMVVRGLDVEDPVVEDVLIEELESFLITDSQSLMVLSFFVEGISTVKEAAEILLRLRARFPQAEFLRVNRDLVGLSDIARRVGVSREAVRKWAALESFPLNLAQVSNDKQQVWVWADIVHWLSSAKNFELEESLPTSSQMTEIDFFLLTSAFLSPRKVWRGSAEPSSVAYTWVSGASLAAPVDFHKPTALVRDQWSKQKSTDFVLAS